MKKLFSIMTVVALLAGIAPVNFTAASYSDELQGAYDYAYGMGITTQSSIDSANMYGQLTRGAMAKMMVNYAKKLGKTADTAKACEFSDVATQSAEFQGYITDACQMGLMGVGITKFNPNGIVTRADFGTVLSRVLWGDANNGGTPYYASHLSALKEAGVMNNISTPTAPEVRGYVMLMMQRADEANVGTTLPAVCSTAENTLACALGLDSCPAECKDTTKVDVTEAKEGTLSVSADAVNYTSIPNIGAVKHATIAFTAGSKDVKVYGVEFKKLALSPVTNAKIYLEKNGARITSKASFSEDKASVSFNTALVVKAGTTEKVDFYLALSAGTAGEQYQFASTSVNSSALTVNGVITTPSMQTVTYTVAQINVTTGGDTSSYKVDSTKLVEFGQFTLTASGSTANNKDLTVKSMTLTQIGDASLNYLTDLNLYRNEEKVSTDAIINGRDVTFLLNDTIKYTSTSATYVVKAKIATADRIGDKFQFQMKYPENTQVIEDSTSFRATMNPTTSISLGSHAINGADLKFNQGPMTYNKTVVPGSKGVVFYSGTISTLGTVNLENLAITAIAGTGTIDAIVKTFYLKVGGTVLSVSAPTTNTGLVTFEGTVAVNGTQNFVIYADIKDLAPATTIKFQDNIDLTKFVGVKEYASNGETITSSVGTLSPVTFTISAASLTLSNSISSTKTVVKSDRNLELANLEFSTSTDVQASVKSFKATLTGTNRGNFKGGSITVYDANGVALVTNSIETGVNTMSFLLPTAARIVKNNPVSFKVKLDQVSTYVSSGDTLQLTFNNVYATNLITSNDLVNTASATSATLKVVGAGQVNVVSQTLTNKLLKLNGSTVVIGTTKFKPYNGDAILKTMTLGGMDVSKFSKVVLKDAGSLVATFVKSGATLYVDNIDQTIAADVTKLYEVEATMISASTAADLAPSTGKLQLIGATFENTNGQTVTVATIPADVSATNTLVKVSPLITDVATIKGSNYASYKITLSSPDGEVRISDLVASLGHNLSSAPTTVSLTSSENGGTVYSSVAYASTATLTGSITVDPTASVVLYLNVGGITWSTSGSSDPYVFIGLSDLGYQDVFSDATTAAHANMLRDYKSSITSLTDLGRNIK